MTINENRHTSHRLTSSKALGRFSHVPIESMNMKDAVVRGNACMSFDQSFQNFCSASYASMIRFGRQIGRPDHYWPLRTRLSKNLRVSVPSAVFLVR